MKIITAFLSLLLIFSINIFGQLPLSYKLDSITVVAIPTNNIATNIFKNICQYQNDDAFYKRVDSLNYDILFVQTNNIDSINHTLEYYFNNGEEVPSMIFINGKKMDSKYLLFQDSLKDVRKKFSPFKNYQILNYPKIQEIYIGCVRKPNRVYKKNRINEMRRTYQIQTIINKEENTIKVSFQKPPKHPKIKITTISIESLIW